MIFTVSFAFVSDFVIDSSGKKYESEGVVHIPFIDESELLNVRSKYRIQTTQKLTECTGGKSD